MLLSGTSSFEDNKQQEERPPRNPVNNSLNHATNKYQQQKENSMLSLKNILGPRTGSASTLSSTIAAASWDSSPKPDDLLDVMQKQRFQPSSNSTTAPRQRNGYNFMHGNHRTPSQPQQRQLQQHQQHYQQQHLPPFNSFALPPHSESPSADGASLARSPLSSDSADLGAIIRGMQESNEKRNQELRNERQHHRQREDVQGIPLPTAFRLTGEVMPKWRTSSTITAQKRQADFEQRRTQQSHQRQHLQQRLQQQQRDQPRIHRPIPSKLPPHVVTIPLYELTVAEASTIFRLRVDVLRNVLDQLGLEPPLVSRNVKDDEGKFVPIQVPANAHGWILSPDTLEDMAVLLDMPYNRVVSKQVLPDERERLLHRRNAATAVVGGKDQDTELSSTAAATKTSAATKAYESLPSRPPVVAVMGHVDHGKTTLMDALRRRTAGDSSGAGGHSKAKKGKKQKKDKSKKKAKASVAGDVAGTEAGGITQVVSAFQVPLDGDTEAVTFLDTPGHKAFRAMRQSGSDAADILVLVVAADDGVSPQTVEIIEFYKSIVRGSGGSGISMVVALNKIDMPGIDAEEAKMRVQAQLLEHGIQSEGMENGDEAYGPPVQIFPISALKGIGLDDMIEGLVLQAEIMELRADNEVLGEGVVMDARLETGVGTVVDCIIRWGTIKKGDIVVSGTRMGRVRVLKDVSNNQVQQGFPSQPVRIIGFNATPNAGDPIMCMESEEAAVELIERRRAFEDADKDGSDSTSSDASASAELQSAGAHMMRQDWKAALEKKHGLDKDPDTDGPIRIPVLVKADADATLAAMRDALVQIGEESKYNVNVHLIKACGASIVCFNVKTDAAVANVASENGVKVMYSDIIYRLLEEAKEEFSKWLPANPVETIYGRGKVKACFDIDGLPDKVAGLEVLSGKIVKSQVKGKDGPHQCKFRVVRQGQVLDDNLVASTLKLFKDDAEEIAAGKECGLSLSKYNAFEEGDEIECYSVEMKQPPI